MTVSRASLERFISSDLVDLLMRYGRIPCLSPAFESNWARVGAIAEAVELYASWFRDRRIPGLTVTVQELPGRTPAIVVDIPASDPAIDRVVLLYGHLDKQPASDPWSEGRSPFEPVLEGERLFGRGMADDGYAGPLAVGVIEQMAAAGVARPRCVVLVEASEESGSSDLEAHLDLLLARLGRIDLVVGLDSGGLDYEHLWVTSSLRGVVNIDLTVRVLRYGVHSGVVSGAVPSSMRILRMLLSRLEREADGWILPEFLHAEIPSAAREQARQIVEELGDVVAADAPAVPGLALMGEDALERLLATTWRPALSFVGVGGIPPVELGGNVLRPFTSARLSLRLPPTIDAADAEAQLVALLTADPPYGAEVTIDATEPGQGWVAPEPEPWLKEALEVGSSAGFGDGARFVGVGGSIPFLAMLGSRLPRAQLVATGAVGPGTNMHGPDESLYLPAATGVAVALAHMIEAAANQAAAPAQR
jgi:acetylornithine deacetylase/succinyl-diaminopimelate desuccinylase-like protein